MRKQLAISMAVDGVSAHPSQSASTKQLPVYVPEGAARLQFPLPRRLTVTDWPGDTAMDWPPMVNVAATESGPIERTVKVSDGLSIVRLTQIGSEESASGTVAGEVPVK